MRDTRYSLQVDASTDWIEIAGADPADGGRGALQLAALLELGVRTAGTTKVGPETTTIRLVETRTPDPADPDGSAQSIVLWFAGSRKRAHEAVA